MRKSKSEYKWWSCVCVWYRSSCSGQLLINPENGSALNTTCPQTEFVLFIFFLFFVYFYLFHVYLFFFIVLFSFYLPFLFLGSTTDFIVEG
jgi:hypothetical protein